MTTRVRLDDLRRHVSALAAAAGLAPARASAFASHLLWYDSAGHAGHGVSRLGEWLQRIKGGEVDPAAEGKVERPEYAGTAILNGQNGVGPLILARAAGLAVEKARDVGVGVVRVSNLGPCGAAAEVAAEVAIGPYLTALVGPSPSWTLALPSADGLPLVFDSVLASDADPAGPDAGPGAFWTEYLGPWASALVPGEGWLLLVIAIAAMEPLGSFHERVAGSLLSPDKPAPGWLLPGPWEAHRRALREQGLQLTTDQLKTLAQLAADLAVPALKTS